MKFLPAPHTNRWNSSTIISFEMIQSTSLRTLKTTNKSYQWKLFFTTYIFQFPDTAYSARIEFNTTSYSINTRTNHHNAFSSAIKRHIICFSMVCQIQVICFCRKFGSNCINLFHTWHNISFKSKNSNCSVSTTNKNRFSNTISNSQLV